nr:PREDICTED: protein D3-like isoform X1 [Bemisia tabaci]
MNFSCCGPLVGIVLSILSTAWRVIFVDTVHGFDWKPSLKQFDGYGEKNEPKTEMERDNLLDKYDIVPDIVKGYPKNVVKVEYHHENGVSMVKFGNFLQVNETRPDPKVTWDAVDSERYVLLMIDPDGEREGDYDGRDWQIYLVTNIVGNNVSRGEMVSDYIPPFASYCKQFHRYIFLVYQQPNHGKIIEYFEIRLTLIHEEYRKKFRSRVFAARYGLGEPIAINFFLGEMRNTTSSTEDY